MKKWLVIAVMSIFLCINALAADEPTVYVSGFGDDANCGTADAPLKTIEAGFYALPSGGRIVIMTAFSFTDTVTEFPAVDGLVTLTSCDGVTDYRDTNGAKLYLSGNVKLRGQTKFEYLDIVVCEKNCVFVCNGHYACFGDGIRTSTLTGDINLAGITGGGTGRHPAKGTFIEIHSGDWFRIRGGRRDSTQEFFGNVNVAVYGGTVHEYLWLAGDAFTNGGGNLYIYGGTFKRGVQLANTTGFSGDVNVSIFGGTFEKAICISNGGTVNGNVTVNILENIGADITLASGVIKGEVKVNLANASYASGGAFDTYIMNKSAVEAAKATAEKSLSNAKSDALKTDWTTAFHERNMSFCGSITQGDKSFASCDVNRDGRTDLKDVLQWVNSKYDADGDGRKTVSDIAAIAKAVAQSPYKAVEKGLGEIKLYGAKVSGETVTQGFAFANAGRESYTLYSDVKLSENSVVDLFFGCDKASPEGTNGYCFEISLESGTLAAYKIVNGSFRTLGTKPLDLLSNEARIRVEYADGAARLYFDDNPSELTQFFDFDFALEPFGDAVGMYVQNAEATLMRCGDVAKTDSGTYQNALISGMTDPDIFCEDGIYYIYGSSGNGGIDCYTTTDFVNFKYEGLALKKGDAFGDTNSFVAANILKYDGLYYMFYLAHSNALGRSTTAYAVSSSPKGPFTNSSHEPLAALPDMIGGQPFLDDDGTVYLIYTRTAGGNQTYGAKVILKDGKATLDLESEKFLLGVTEEWEAARASVVECGLIVKHGGLYYLLYAGGNYNSSYGVGYAVSEEPLGPYTKYEHNPVLIGNTQSYGVGAASVFPSADGREYFIIYLRNFSYAKTRPLETCMDRFRFVKDPLGGADIIEICGPSVTTQAIPSALGSMTSDEWQSIRFHP